jgi:hypothetical protein
MNHNDQEELKNVDKAVLKNEVYKKFIISFIFYIFVIFFVSLYVEFWKSSSIKNWGLFVTQTESGGRKCDHRTASDG